MGRAGGKRLMSLAWGPHEFGAAGTDDFGSVVASRVLLGNTEPTRRPVGARICRAIRR
jgi:hypothetical protein